jgi:predicted PhzF superfamily epimerase YddE/YHI9
VAALRYVVCDVFTDTPLQGNQLAVFTDAREIPRTASSHSPGR